MSASKTDAEAPEDVVVAAPGVLAPAVGNLFDELLRYGAAKLSRGLGGWLGDLEHAMISRGPIEAAAFEAAQARLLGKNPLWAGAKGAWAGASVPQRVAAVVVLVLLLLLAPVPVVLLVLGLLVAALVAAIRAAMR